MNQKQNGPNRFESSKRNLINIDIDGDNWASYGRKTWIPRTHQEELALELALTLHDRKGLPFYLSCVKAYPEPFLRRVLSKVMRIPDNKIKKSRGALFNFLARQAGADN
jgi:hypothetical protein